MADEINLELTPVVISDIQGPENEPLNKKIITLDGKLITAEDPILVGKNFTSLINMRYGDSSPKSILGMTKINSSKIDLTYFKIRNGFHFNKIQPAETTVESHVLVQSYNTDFTASCIYQNITAIPSTGNFETTSLWTDSSGAGLGMFSDAPGGQIAYCNGIDACLWGGDGIPISKFLNFDPAKTFSYDFTDVLSNSKTSETATLTASTEDYSGTATALLLHLNNDVVDSGPNVHTVTNSAVTFDSVLYKFGSYAGIWNGVTSYLSIPDHADFDFSDGTWTIDGWFEFNTSATDLSLYYQETVVTKIVFSAGAHEVVAGEVVHQNAGATGTVLSVTVTSGAWGAAAAGIIWLHSVGATPWANGNNMEDASHNVVAMCDTCTTDLNYFSIYAANNSDTLSIDIKLAGVVTTILTISGLSLCTGTLHHLEFSENGDNWYIFKNGNMVATGISALRAANYNSIVYIGLTHNGNIDEFRINKGCNHTEDFIVPTVEYEATVGTITKVYIQTQRPAQGFKFYLSHANDQTSTTEINVWDGNTFSACTSLSDGTIGVAGKTLSQNGSITFDSTVGVAKTKYIDGVYAYCYELIFNNINSDTEIYHVTVDCPFQHIVDLWDGIQRNIAKLYLNNGTKYSDYTINVYEDYYNTADTTTYLNLRGITSSAWMEVGFVDRMTAVGFNFIPDWINSTPNTIVTVYYWNGKEFVNVGTVTDGTSINVVSMAAPGVISWSAPDELTEQKKTINNGVPLYYYKFVWNTTIASDAMVSYVYGVPAQKTIRGYKFSLLSQNRLLLCNNYDEDRNSLIYSEDETAQIFNGDDSGKIYFGDNTELTCGCNIFSQFSQSLYNITLIFKDKEMWGLVYGPDGWQKYSISESIGCNCPKTLKTAIIPPLTDDRGGNRNIAIWMHSSSGIYISDGRHPIMVSHDIRNYFDQNSSIHVNKSFSEQASAWVDQENIEYHLSVALTTGTVTTNDAEFVLDLRRWKWFVIDRGTSKDIQCGINVTDSSGNKYNYGFLDSGYMERLEYGNTFDDTSITSTYQTGDISLIDGDFLTETRVKKIIQAMVSKTVTTQDVTITHYIDSYSVGTDYTCDPTKTGYRITFPLKDANSIPGIFHSFKGTITVSNETIGYEPLALGVYYETVRDYLSQ